jgi:hypothetical protein
MPIIVNWGFREKTALVVSWTCETNEVSDVNRLEAKVTEIVLILVIAMILFITKVWDSLPGGSS